MNIPVDQLLAMADRALDKLDWGQVYALASDVLLIEPDNAVATTLRGIAARRGGRTSLPGRRQATILFADLVGSTQLAECHDVEIYSGFLRAFVCACSPAITQQEGHLIDVKGDGIVASFGYPNAHEDDAYRAVTAALDMLAALRPVAAELQSGAGIRLRVRIGIDTGVVVADGADIRGSALNRAARLQDLASPDSVLITAGTHQLVADRFETRSLGGRELKGVDAPVEVFMVLRPRAPSRYAALTQTRSVPFIGRDAELAQVLELWDEVVEGRTTPGTGTGPSSVVLVVGEPGIGKSRLASAAVERISESARHVLQLYCSSYTATSTLFPLRAALESYADLNPDDTANGRLNKVEAACTNIGIDPAGILPVLSALLDLDLAGRYAPLDLSPTQLQRVLLERLTALLPALTDGPAAVVVEDIQWADPATLELIDRLAAAGLPRGLLIVGAARPDLGWTPSHDSVHTVRLNPLPTAQAQELALAAGADRITAEQAREIAARGDGVPLFVEQLTHALGEISVPSLARDSMPQTLIQLLQARLDAVGSAKLVAQVAATIGREFHVPVLENVLTHLGIGGPSELESTPLDHDLKRLADADLVEPMDQNGLLRFRHQLMRDAAYQSQLMRDRRVRHGGVAEVMAAAKTSEPALTAFHFERAERPIEALVHYLQAVRRGQTAGTFAEVLAHLERCNELLDSVPDESLRARFELAVRLNRGLAVSSTAGYVASGVVDDYNRARELCATLGAVPGVAKELLKVLFAIWNYYCTSGDFDTAGTICSTIERELGRATMASGQHGLDSCRGVEALCRGDIRRAEELLSRGVAGMTRDGVDPDEWWQPHDPLAASCAVLGPVRFMRGDEAGALDAIQAGMRRSQPLGFPRGPFSMAFMHMYESILHRRRQDGPAATAAAERVIQIGQRHGFADWQIVGQIHLAAAHAVTDGPSSAPDELGAVLKTWRSVGGEMLIPSLLVEQAEGYLARDDLEHAAACLDRAFGAMRLGQCLGLPGALRLRAEVRLRTDPSASAAAEVDLREAIHVARTQGDVHSMLRAALTHRRLLPSQGNALIDVALAEAVAAYQDAAGFPDLAQARALLAEDSVVRSD